MTATLFTYAIGESEIIIIVKNTLENVSFPYLSAKKVAANIPKIDPMAKVEYVLWWFNQHKPEVSND